MHPAKICQIVAQKSLTNKPLITVLSLKTGKERLNFLEPELSKEYYLATEKLSENIYRWIYILIWKYIHNIWLSGKACYGIVCKASSYFYSKREELFMYASVWASVPAHNMYFDANSSCLWRWYFSFWCCYCKKKIV